MALGAGLALRIGAGTMDDIVERMRALMAEDEAEAERSRALRHSWLRWLGRPLAPADR